MLTIKINDILELSKFTNILKCDIKVLTPSGLKKIYGVGVTSKNSDVFRLRTKKHELLCSPNHLIKSNNKWINTKDFKIGDIIDTKYGQDRIDEISVLDYKDDLLDLHVETNEYYSNDIVSHNSSLLDSFDYTLYGKCRGKRKKWTNLSSLPNRINGELLNRIKFKSNGVDVEIKRGISPNVLELIENEMPNKKAGKSNLDDKIESYIGMDIETFKSFISMNVDSFKNFISLSNEEKQLLLDKLFNLEVINILNSILKDVSKNNKIRIASLDSEIKTLDESISSINKSIENAIEKEKENIQLEIDKLVEEIKLKKEDFKLLKEKIDKIKEKEKEILNEIDSEKLQYSTILNDIKNVQSEISLYDSGKCPTCKTDFNSDYFTNLRISLIDKKNKLIELKSEIENNIKLIKERQNKLQSISDKTTKSFNDLNYLLRGYKSEIDKLNSKKISQDSKESINISEFKKSITDLENKKLISYNNSYICKEKELYYKELNRIFSEEGVKKSIIKSIISPINHFISENTKKMGLIFDVKLDETFTAEIKHLGSIIEHDSLSTGETKKINISILIAYLKLIRTKKHINILFLDEVFSSIDIEGIDSILLLLKSFANEYNINIFVVHHAILSQEMFDRIIQINKEIFTSINEIVIKTS